MLWDRGKSNGRIDIFVHDYIFAGLLGSISFNIFSVSGCRIGIPSIVYLERIVRMNFLDTLKQMFSGVDTGHTSEWINAAIGKKKEEVSSYTRTLPAQGMNYGQLTNQTPPNYSEGAGAFIPMPDNFSASDPTQFSQVLKPLAETYGVPMSLATGQKFAENRGEPGNKNNYYNLGATDLNPEGGMKYDSPVQGIESYLKFITGTAEESFYGNGKEGKKAYQDAFTRFKQTGDTEAFLQEIKNAGYASRPDYVDFVKSTPEWRNFK